MTSQEIRARIERYRLFTNDDDTANIFDALNERIDALEKRVATNEGKLNSITYRMASRHDNDA